MKNSCTGTIRCLSSWARPNGPLETHFPTSIPARKPLRPTVTLPFTPIRKSLWGLPCRPSGGKMKQSPKQTIGTSGLGLLHVGSNCYYIAMTPCFVSRVWTLRHFSSSLHLVVLLRFGRPRSSRACTPASRPRNKTGREFRKRTSFLKGRVYRRCYLDLVGA